jgi:putative transposase
MAGVFTTLQRLKDSCLEALTSRLACWTKPLRTSLPLSTLTDLGRSKSELLAENALLRQQLIVLKRQVKRPTFTKTDRILLVLVARLVRSWQQAHITRATRHEARAGIGGSSASIGSEDQRPLPTSRK